MTNSASVFEEVMAYRKQESKKLYCFIEDFMNEGKMNFHSKSVHNCPFPIQNRVT